MRFPRFRLRTLLVACSTLCVLLALYILPAYRQRQAASALTARGAYVYYDRELDANGKIRKQQHPIRGMAHVLPTQLRWYQAWLHCDLLERVEVVVLGGLPVDDPDHSELLCFPNLVELNLFAVWETDESLERIGQLKSLRRLNLANTLVTDAGMPHLVSLTELEELSLARTKVSDRGLSYICQLKNLQTLDLCRTQVTARNLEELTRLTKLKHLDLDQTDAEAADVAKLRRALPNCHIEWQPH